MRISSFVFILKIKQKKLNSIITWFYITHMEAFSGVNNPVYVS
jgi:hypothetical protein